VILILVIPCGTPEGIILTIVKSPGVLGHAVLTRCDIFDPFNVLGLVVVVGAFVSNLSFPSLFKAPYWIAIEQPMTLKGSL
jgi:hypothetical protein